MNKPRAAPARSSSLCRLRRARGRYAAMSAAARVKRNARNRKTLEWERELLTKTKVAPQRSVQRTRARSALMEAGWEDEVEELMAVRRGSRASERRVD